MKIRSLLPLSVVAAGAVLGMAATAASAASTTVRQDTATGTPYSGNWQVSTVGPVTFGITFFGQKITGTCDTANLKGTLASTGEGALTAASIGACTTSNGLSSPPTDLGDLPDNTGHVTYNPITGGRDGTLTIDGDLTFTLEGDFLFAHRTCHYAIRTNATNTLTFDLYNRDNPNRPLPNDDAQGKAVNVTLVKLTGSDGLCPNNGTLTATAIARGETTPDSGTYDRKLYVTS